MESWWLLMCLQKKKKRHKSKFTLWKEKKWKVEKNEKQKKYMKKVVAKIRMKEDGPKRCHMPKLCALLVF